VPTMGSLHEGHYALIDAARRECDFVVVSIFVNPTQFGPGEDYERYPRPLEADLAGCESHGVDAVFAPSADAMYAPGFATTVHVEGLTTGLCGRSRPGHFDGVTTVVAKLLNIVLPDVAYFGAKDYQQAAVVRRMAADLNMPLRVEVCPTVREADGLAMSSRNAYLTAEERAQAPALVESLRLARRLVAEGRRDAAELADQMRRAIARRAPLGRIDYVEIVDPDSLQNVQTIDGPVVAALAVRFPSARLIDNMRIDPPGSSG
ncbi:MAG: pantoate--beta-alanine ligase, partial [Phycisphaerae bacterium SM23_33]